MSKNDYICVFAEIIIIIIAGIIRDYNTITWLSFFQILIIGLNINSNNKDKKILFGLVFVLISYIFHFGQALIYMFGLYDKYEHLNVINRTSEQEVVIASLFAMLCYLFLHIGYYIERVGKVNSTNNYVDNDNEKYEVKKIALVIFAVSLIPMIYIDISKIIALRTGGYLSTYLVYREGIGKYLNLIGRFCKPVIPVLIYAFSDDRKKATMISILFGLYLIVVMFSGDRGTSMIYLITIVLIYFNYVKPLKFRYIIIGVILVYLLLGILTTISLYRDQQISVDTFISSVDRRNTDGILYSVLREFGGTMISLVYAMRYFPGYSPFNYGLTYIASFLSVFPVLPTPIFNLFGPSFSFVSCFPLNVQAALGGSVFGEAYHNFGWIAPLLFVFIGSLLSRIDRTFEYTNSSRVTSILIVLIPNILLWTRDLFSSMVFNCFWLAIAFRYIKVRNKN